MQFEPEYRFDMDDSFSLCSQSMSCPSTTTSFSSASSAYDPFTPSSRRSTPNQSSLDFANAGAPQCLDLSPSATMPKYNLFSQVKAEPEHMPFSETVMPTTPMKKIDGLPTEYDLMLDLNMTPQNSVGSMTPSNSFGLYTVSPETAMGPASFMMTPTQSLSGSDITDPTSVAWACHNNPHESPINFFAQRSLSGQEYEAHAHAHSHSHSHSHALGFALERHAQSPMNHFNLHGPPSPGGMRAHRKMKVHELQRKTSDLQRAQMRASRKRQEKSEGTTHVDVVRRAMCKCDYPGCSKAFRRNEHLKRHKQTYHGEGPNRFTCEFCGKDQFNRQDNLNNHRKLHARPNSRNRGVEYIPAAVAIIDQEERCRKRRAPSKAKLAAAAAAVAAGDDYCDGY